MRMDQQPEMPATTLKALLRLLSESGIETWLDGGWGVDALLGRQTRTHRDVDLILRLSDVTGLLGLLCPRGFSIRSGTPPSAFVLADGAGLEIDVHAVAFDAHGNGIYRMENGQDWVFPAEGFAGVGIVAGLPARCLTPEVQVLCHAHGYVPTAKDRRDMAYLQQRFGVDLPQHLREL